MRSHTKKRQVVQPDAAPRGDSSYVNKWCFRSFYIYIIVTLNQSTNLVPSLSTLPFISFIDTLLPPGGRTCYITDIPQNIVTMSPKPKLPSTLLCHRSCIVVTIFSAARLQTCSLSLPRSRGRADACLNVTVRKPRHTISCLIIR